MGKKLTVEQAGESLGITPHAAYMLIYRKRLKATKFGNQWMIDESDLDAVRDRRVGNPGTPRGRRNLVKAVMDR